MKWLAFERDGAWDGARRVRAARFERRSLLAVSAACVVANAVRESLKQLFGSSNIGLRLFEPVIPSPEAWSAIAGATERYRVRGSLCDAVVLLRETDAAALAAFAFGESCGAERPLSLVERAVLDRLMNAVANACVPICGAGSAVMREQAGAIAGCTTYVEMLVEGPVCARIGIAISREPLAKAHSELCPDDLLDLEVELAVRTESAFAPAAGLAGLEPGDFVPITRSKVLRGTVLLAGTPLACGECGIREGRFALIIDSLKNGERSLVAAS